ncbi:MAG: UvrD-helicase domain-containing protein [Candidatus Cloacimonadaceae bacterium]|nr:UvrD-helicase domain-containing protein [Candidatus Cloacimonadaceae bacterium]
MSDFNHRIISASAGTGKTYRLAIEYVSLVLKYYGKNEFCLDNILVLTFTRKATAEIRERIQENLSLLCSNDPKIAEVKAGLIKSLRPDGSALSIEEENMLLSALRELSADRKLLQVMTIDSYINGIFRNIVRPLRSIDRFDIDLQAVEKRMPFLLAHLMKPELKERLESLLRRRVRSSLDYYEEYFGSMIEARWLYYLITKRLKPASEGTLQAHHKLRDEVYASLQRDSFFNLSEELLNRIDLASSDKSGDLKELFNVDFVKLFGEFPATISSLMQKLIELGKTDSGCLKIFGILKEKNIFNANKFRKSKTELQAIQDAALKALANYLMQALFIPEQEEILGLWEAILQEYDELIYRYKNMTYNDISWFSLEALFSDDPPNFDLAVEANATEFYQFLSHRSRFILIDEFQDTSLIQFNILKPIIEEIIAGEGTKPFGGLVVVGDEKQSIFGWRGGERDLLLNLPVIFPSMGRTEPEVLRSSWRSSPMMMRFINNIFSDKAMHAFLEESGMNWKYEEISSAKPEIEPLSLLEFSCKNYQTRSIETSIDDRMQEFVSVMVKPAVDSHPHETMAILCRKGNDLTDIQAILEDNGIASIYQPSSNLLDHGRIAGIVHWLRYLAYRDWMDYLAFLRSDYVLVKPKPLKSVIDSISAYERSEEIVKSIDFSAVPVAEYYYQKALEPVSKSIAELCEEIIADRLPATLLSERDYLNLHSFIRVARDFEAQQSSGGNSIGDFLQYLEENRKQEFMKQVAVEGADNLQLLTIHKSKGLEFHRVFVFYNLSSRHGSDTQKLKWYANFSSADFKELSDFALTYHYNALLEHSDFASLQQDSERRAMLEELNNLYVAFTRAKTKLHIFIVFEGSKNWVGYFGDPKAKMTIPKLLCDAARNVFITDDAVVVGEDYYRLKPEAETLPVLDEDESTQDETLSPQPLNRLIASILPKAENAMTANPESADKDWKKIWLMERHNLFGDLAHCYLSFIKKNLSTEHQYALRQCLSRYCNVLPESGIIEFVDKIKLALASHPELFDARWDKVFTEFGIQHRGREYRLDRLMLDTKAKAALIVDFKTGGIHELDQLDHYRKALLSLPVFDAGNYVVETLYIKLKL